MKLMAQAFSQNNTMVRRVFQIFEPSVRLFETPDCLFTEGRELLSCLLTRGRDLLSCLLGNLLDGLLEARIKIGNQLLVHSSRPSGSP